MIPPLLIRADASAVVGTGHVMRMLALAEAWQDAGGSVLCVGAMPAGLAERFTRAAVGLRYSGAPPGSADDVRETVAAAAGVGASAVVADGYCFSAVFQRGIRASGLRLMVVDDNAENADYDADWVLNVNVHAKPEMYANRAAHTHLLLGPRYALIRREFRQTDSTRLEQSPGTQRILVSMGGADPPDATGQILGRIGEVPDQVEFRVVVGPANTRGPAYAQVAMGLRQSVRLERDVQDMSEAMRWADVAVTGAGGTIWESALVGVPSVVVSLADNQVRLARGLDELGAVVYAGDARESPRPASWLASALSLLPDFGRRQRLVAAARSLVDGDGAARVVEALRRS